MSFLVIFAMFAEQFHGTKLFFGGFEPLISCLLDRFFNL